MLEDVVTHILHLDPAARTQRPRHEPHVAGPVRHAVEQKPVEDVIEGLGAEARVAGCRGADLALHECDVWLLGARLGDGGDVQAVDVCGGIGYREIVSDDAGAAAYVEDRLGRVDGRVDDRVEH